MLFSIEKANKLSRNYNWTGERLNKIFSNTKYDISKADLDISAEKYLTASFLSALIYGTAFFALFGALLFFKDGETSTLNTVFSAAIGLAFFGVFFALHIVYPKLLAKQYATEIDQSLLFALKSMLIQVSSGVSLFAAMVNVGKSNYGTVSTEFENVAKEISGGESEIKALEKLALKTKSDYLKKTSWQLLTSIRSGASLSGALSSVVEMLSNNQMRAIKNYSAELNFWILMYLLMAGALPTLGITFMVILSTMGGSPIGSEFVLLLIAGSAATQMILIGFVKTRIPKVY